MTNADRSARAALCGSVLRRLMVAGLAPSTAIGCWDLALCRRYGLNRFCPDVARWRTMVSTIRSAAWPRRAVVIANRPPAPKLLFQMHRQPGASACAQPRSFSNRGFVAKFRSGRAATRKRPLVFRFRLQIVFLPDKNHSVIWRHYQEPFMIWCIPGYAKHRPGISRFRVLC